MILILDLDRTLNRLYPPWTRSIRDLVPPAVVRRGGYETWEWVAAHLAERDYPVHEAAVPVVRALSAHASRVIVNTGRPEMAWHVTDEWLRSHFRVDRLLMRAKGDFRRTVEIKRDHFTAHILSRNQGELIYAFDDNPEAVTMYNEHGAIALLAPKCWTALARAERDGPSVLRHFHGAAY